MLQRHLKNSINWKLFGPLRNSPARPGLKVIKPGPTPGRNFEAMPGPSQKIMQSAANMLIYVCEWNDYNSEELSFKK